MKLAYWLTAVAALPLMHPAPAVAAPTDAGQDSEERGLADIVVTAQKQSQTLQKTPVAVTALDGAELQATGVTDIRAAQAFVPSVRFQQEGASTEIYIRGVGSTLDYPQIDPPTSFNFNGIYVPREGTSVGLYDVDSLEVLPGPQGTLYGRSTLGGAVNVNFKRPTSDLSTESALEVGNYSLVHATIAQNIPVSDTLSVRGAFDYTYHQGYMTSGADSANNYGARLSILYKPSDSFTAYIWGAVADLNGSPPNLVPKGVNPDTLALEPNRFLNKRAWNDQFPASYVGTLPAGQPQAEHWKYSNQMIGGQFDLRLSDVVTLTYIPSYLHLAAAPSYWLGAFPGNLAVRYDQVTQELRLSGESGRLRWIGGLYGYHMISDGIFSFGARSLGEGGFPVSIVDRNKIQGAAVFGQATYSLTDALRLTMGGRFSHDDRVGRGRFFDGAGLSPYTYDKAFDHFDFKAGVEADIAPRALLYATVQTGYQPGTFNAFASSAVSSNAINQAKLTAYSAGLKSRFFNNILQINNEFFYYDYRGLFVSAYDTVLNTNRTFNANKVQIYGDQLDIVLRATEDDNLNLSVGYLHAQYKDFTLPLDSAFPGQSFRGYQVQYSPTWTISGGYSHDFRMAKGYLRARVNTRYESAFFADFNHTPGGRQKAYIKSDASLTYHEESGQWSLGLWVKNIENRAVIAATAGGSNIPFNPQGATSFLEAPRTYGLRATFKM